MVRSLVAEHEVDDVLQDTWLAALRHRPRVGSLRAWLASVARNAARTRHRLDVRRRRREASVAAPDAQPSTAETVEKLALQASVARAVAELDEPYREAVILRYHDGLSHAEIASAQGVSIDNARQRVKRGLDRLRRCLAEERGSRWQRGAAVVALLREPEVSGPLVFSNVSLGVWIMSHGSRIAVALLVVAAAVLSVQLWSDAPAPLEPVPEVGAATMQSEAESIDAVEPEVGRRRSAVEAAAPPPPEPDEPLAPFRGSVVDTLGRPLSGVAVRAILMTELELAQLEREGRPDDLPGNDREVARTDAQGQFSLATSDQIGRLRVGSPFVMLHGPADPRKWDRAADMLLVVTDEASVSGVVSDSHGVPLDAVQIEVEVARVASVPMSLASTHRVRFDGLSTGPDGRFALDQLPGSHGRLRFTKPGYRSVTRPLEPGVRAGDSVVLERLQEGRYSLHGTVTDAAGRPLDGARIGTDAIVTRSDRYGSYRLELDDRILDQGDPLFAAMPGAQTFVRHDPRSLFQSESDVRLDITLSEPLVLAGRVVTPGGEPVSGVHVRLWMEPELLDEATGADLALEGLVPQRVHEVAKPRAYAVTGSDGVFELAGLEDKPYQLRLRHEKSWVAWTEGPLRAGLSDLEMVAPLAEVLSEVTGRVVDRRGLPVAGVKVEFSVQVHRSPSTNSWSGPETHVVTGADGGFRFAGVPVADEVLIVASGDDILVRMQICRAEQLRDEVVLVVDALCTFRIHCADSAPARFALRDVEDERVRIWERRGKSRTAHDTFPLTEGRSPILTASDRAHFVVFFDRDREEIGRTLVRLVPGELTRVQQ